MVIASLEAEAQFLAEVSELSDAVDAELERLIRAEDRVANLHEALIYALGLDSEDRRHRGKRIRPALCLMVAEALGASRAQALPFAVAMELLHNFALVHDDIEDGDRHRRGRDCVYIKYGLPHGINIGDYFLTMVFRIVSRDRGNSVGTRDALAELLHDTLQVLLCGQAEDINARGLGEFTVADYNRIVAAKTGSYLAAPLLGGALIAGASEGTLAALRVYGAALGPLFQIRDDVIDLTTGKGREHVGNDIREGKRSYLLAAFSELAAKGDVAEVFAILDKPRETTTGGDVVRVMQLFRERGAMARAEATCDILLANAVESVAAVEAPLRDVLTVAARVLNKRMS